MSLQSCSASPTKGRKPVIGRILSLTVVVSLLSLGFASLVFAQAEFDASELSCAEFTSGQRAGSPSHGQYELARIWALGYLAGYYVGSDNAELVGGAVGAGPIYDSLHQMCQGFPESSLLTVSMLTLTAESLQLPTEPVPGFRPQTYSCAQHTQRKGSGDAEGAAAAELWAFAFLQGHQNVEQPYVVIPASSMEPMIAVLVNGCQDNGDTLFLDYATGVARAVRVDTPR